MTSAIEQVANSKWFHSIDFGGYASSGRFKPGSPQNITLFGVFEYLRAIPLAGAAVLDIGTYDGIVAFGSRALGAGPVIAVDSNSNPSFLLARQLLGYGEGDVEYMPGVQIKDLSQQFGPAQFDVVVCAGVIYHMLFPQQAFTETRKVLREGGYLLMEAPFADGDQQAVLYFNGMTEHVNEPSTYFVPTRPALVGMANLTGFKLVATRILQAPKRVTLLLQAASRRELIDDPQTPPFVVQMLKRDLCDHEFRFKDLESSRRSRSVVAGDPALPLFREIVATEEVVSFPYHPARSVPTYGATRFETEVGNTLKL
jgi:2-polyprenyl-3-methyl-5-hydroxy-6-metoxy-1,4-benzoquinol methylase